MENIVKIANKKMYNIAQIGAFDLESYGDNLFPFIFYNEMSKRIKNIKIDFYGPYGKKLNFGVKEFDIRPLIKTNSYKLLTSYGAIIIGGGDIIRLDEATVSNHYKEREGIEYSDNFRPCRAMLIYRPWFWLSKCPLIFWNAVGVVDRNKLYKKITASVDLLSVRDNASKANLLKCGVKKEILVIPDTALRIKETLNRDFFGYAESLRQMVFQKKCCADTKKILGFHCSKWFLNNGMDLRTLAKKLLEFSNRYHLQVILIPINLCHGDLQLLKTINSFAKDSFILFDERKNILDTTALISQCNYLVASSLHANITASSFGIPHLAINSLRWSKISGFLKIIDRKMCVERWGEFDQKLTQLIAENKYTSKNRVVKAKKIIAQYFDLVAEKITQNEK